jgi:ElaB/YqjD/DUF883 family membrane-anchored ribosome-binding protein
MSMSDDPFEKGKAAAREVKNIIRAGADEVAATSDSVARDVRRMADRARDAVSDAAANVGDSTTNGVRSTVASVADAATDLAKRTTASARDAADELQEATAKYVSERPLTALIIAAVGGAIIATLLHRLRE